MAPILRLIPEPTCTGGYLCTCNTCEAERLHAIALAKAGARDKPQPWHPLARAA